MHMNRFTVFVVDQDRYGGAYSGAPYTAWENSTPDGIDGGDSACCDVWQEIKKEGLVYGKGTCPDTALADLIKKRYKDKSEIDLEFWLVYFTGIYGGEECKKQRKPRALSLYLDYFSEIYPISMDAIFNLPGVADIWYAFSTNRNTC